MQSLNLALNSPSNFKKNWTSWTYWTYWTNWTFKSQVFLNEAGL